MIDGELLIIACALVCALSCLLFWIISQRERRFLTHTLTEMRRINDEWRQETQTFWDEVGAGPRAPKQEGRDDAATEVGAACGL